MSISNLSGFGDNNKLYSVRIRMYLESRDVFMYIYSSSKINSRNDLSNFLLKQPNYTIGLLGTGYKYNDPKVLIPCFLRRDPAYDIIYLFYYMNDETGYRNINLTNVTFENTEV